MTKETIPEFPEITEEEKRRINALFRGYLFFRTEKDGGREFWSTCCGAHFSIHGIRRTEEPWEWKYLVAEHNEIVQCPKCGCPVWMKSVGRSKGRKNLEEFNRVAVLQVDEAGNVYMQAAWARKDYREELLPEVEFSQKALCRFTPEKAEGWMYQWQGKDYGWTKMKTIREPFQKDMYAAYSSKPQGYHVIGMERLKQSFLRYCAYDLYEKHWYDKRTPNVFKDGYYHDTLLRYLAAATRRPQLEMLVKMGMWDAVADLVIRKRAGAGVDWRQKDPRKAFGLTAEELVFFMEKKGDLGLLRHFHQMKKREGLTIQETADLLDIERREYGDHTTFSGWNQKIGGDARSAIKYIRKNGNRWEIWKDYLEAAEFLKYDLTVHNVAYPKNLQKAHDEAIANRIAVENKKEEQEMKERRWKLEKTYGFHYSGYFIRAPRSVKEIIRESGQRDDSADPGGAVSAVEGRAGQNPSGTVERRSADREAASLTYGKAVSTAALGIGGGNGRDSIRIVTGGDTEHTAKARAIAKERGLRLTLFTGGNLSMKKGGATEYASVRGYVTGDRVFIRADHQEFTADQIMEHEAGHDRIAKGEIDPDAVRERISRELGKERVDELAAMYEAAYRGTGLTAEQIWEEVICDSQGDMNIFSGTIHEEAATELLGETKKAASAEAETAKMRGPPQRENGGKSSIEKLPDGRLYVKADRQVIFGADTDSWRDQLEDYINGKIRRGENVQLIAADGDVLTLTAETAGKVSSPYRGDGRSLSDAEYERKVNAGAHIDELAEVSRSQGKKADDQDSRHGDFASGGWEYRDAYFLDYDGQYYQVTISTAINDDGKTVYNIGKMRKRDFPNNTGSSAKGGAQSVEGVSLESSVPPESGDVNGKTSQDLENVEALKRENGQLKARVEYWKGQNKLTTERTPDSAAVRTMARELIEGWQSKLKPVDITGDLEEVWKALNRDRASAARLKELASTAARKLVETARAEAPGQWQDYKDAAEYLRTVKLRVTPDLEGELASRGGYGEFRKDNFGRLKLSSKAGLPIDTAYMELAQRYPGLFDAEAHNNVADMLFHMEEVAAQLVPVYENPHGYDINSAVEAAENEIVSAIMEGKVPDAKGTMADRLKKRYLEAREADVKRITERANEKYRNYRESRSLTEAKVELEKTWKQLAQKVLKPTDKKHVPEAMRASIAEVLECINLESGFDLELGKDALYHRTEKGRGEPTKRTEAFRELKKELTRLSGEGTTTVDPDLLGDDGYLEAVIKLKDKPMSQMTSAEVRLVNRVLREVSAAAENANKLFSGRRWETVSDAAEEIRRDNRNKREVKNYKGVAGKAQILVGLDMLTPEAYFHRLGKGGDDLFRSLRKAQDIQTILGVNTLKVVENIFEHNDSKIFGESNTVSKFE